MDSRRSLTDEQWTRFAGALARIKRRGPRGRDDRQVIDAVIWILRTGVSWRDLPDSLGKWSTVYQRFRRWAVAGRWEGLRCALARHEEPADLLLIDSTIVKAHPQAAGARRTTQALEALGRSLKVFRRVATRYEKTAASYGAVVAQAALLAYLSGWAA